jgi:hypothetical protein
MSRLDAAAVGLPSAALPVAEVRALAGHTLADSPYLTFDCFAEWDMRALVTTRAAGSFSTAGEEPVRRVMDRWAALQAHLFPASGGRFATARQVHGAEVVEHRGGWSGWLRGHDADGHVAFERGTAMAVSIADCVPVFVAHRSGAAAVLHSGWRGTEAGILRVAVQRLARGGAAAGALRVLLGPAICGGCYEVSPEVYERLTGERITRPTPVDLHAVLAGQARAAGVSDVWRSPLCTRCDNALLFSHRGGDSGRQLAALVAEA